MVQPPHTCAICVNEGRLTTGRAAFGHTRGTMRLRSLLTALSLTACARTDAKREAGKGGEQATSTSVQVPAEVQTVCTAVARFWSQRGAQVRAADSVLVPPLGDTSVAACVVQATQAHGGRLQMGGSAAGGDAGPEAVPALVASTTPHWVSLLPYSADGPDGNLVGYQRRAVRCTVASSWDGGDDSDSTYVPEDWFKEETSCWLEPRGIAMTDTAP